MRSLTVRLFAIAMCVAVAFVFTTTGCPAPNTEKGGNQETPKGTDGGTDKDPGKTDAKPTERRVDPTDDNKPGDTKPGDTTPGDTKPGEVDPSKICPPGCADPKVPGCSGGNPAALKKVGEECTVPKAGEKNPCESGLTCFEARVLNGRFFRPVTTCVPTCSSNDDCKTPGQTCVATSSDGSTPKICVELKQLGERCDPTQRILCGSSSGGPATDCLVKDINNDNEGVCTARCQNQSECPANSGQLCRKPIPDAVVNYCLSPALPGPKCLGEKCDVSSNATNCLSGLTCNGGVCMKVCTKANEQTDCDVANGETCQQDFGAKEGLCLPKPTVTKAGDECSPFKRCDDTQGLTCVAESQEKSICAKKCDDTKGEDNNPDCGADQLCQKPASNSATGICRNKAKILEPCSVSATCAEKPSACINVSNNLPSTCLKLCEKANNKSEDDETNTKDCGGARCRGLNNPITSDGKAYDGVCFPDRPKTKEAGEGCDMTQKLGGLKSPDCKDGARCVFLSGTPGPQCFVDCDPCKQTRKNADEWVHAKCANNTKSCIGLTSGGRPSGGICLPDGNPVRDEGEFCDFQNGCKNPDKVVCVRFSNADDASSVCSRRCDPEKGRNSNPECPGNGQCGGLTGGGGVCIPVAKRSQKLGENCNGPIGTPRFNDCNEKTSDGKPMLCAEPDITGIDGTCQVQCDATKGFAKNPDCVKNGFTNHLCLPGDLTQPQKGACLELCSFSSRKDCSQKQCKIGQCREMLLGKRGDCTDATKEADCKTNGGACINKTCIATVCL